jgi:hypothetical protein
MKGSWCQAANYSLALRNHIRIQASQLSYRTQEQSHASSHNLHKGSNRTPQLNERPRLTLPQETDLTQAAGKGEEKKRQRARETRQGPSTARLPSSHAPISNSSVQPNQTPRNLGPTTRHATARTKPSPKRRSTQGVGTKRSETKLKNDTENWRGKRAPAGPDPDREGGRAHPRRSGRKRGRPLEKNKITRKSEGEKMETTASTFSPRETRGWGRREEREKNGTWLFSYLRAPGPCTPALWCCRAGACETVCFKARQRVRASIYNFPGPGGGIGRFVACSALPGSLYYFSV